MMSAIRNSALPSTPLYFHTEISRLHLRGVQFVLFNRNLRERHVNAIVCDHVAAARLIVWLSYNLTASRCKPWPWPPAACWAH
jgi:hypothetical protein